MTDTHPGVTAELRALLVTALDRLAPLLDGVTTDTATAPTTCAGCPVCAVLALLRGERSELAARLAEQLSGLVTVLRAALDEDAPTPAPRPAPASNGRVVQRIHVERPC